MSETPTVSVVMAVYNSAEYLPEAIESILNQSFQDFELLAINDGSTDGSADILAAYARTDSRVRVFNQPNSGVAASRNIGFQQARGKYIALMDSDDVSLPERLEKQVAFLEANPEIGFCGVRCSFFGELGEFVGACPPVDPKRLKCRMLFLTTVSNTSIVMRRDLVVKHNLYYDTSFPVTEDYEMITRFLPHCGVANLPVVLMKIRTHSDSITRRYPDEVHYRNLTIVHRRLLSAMGIKASDEELAIHLSMCTRAFPPKSREDLDALEQWLFRLIEANEKTRFFDPPSLTEMLAGQWISMCAIAETPLLTKWRTFTGSNLYTIGRRICRRSVLSLALQFLRSYLSMTLEKSAAGRSFKRFVRKGPSMLRQCCYRRIVKALTLWIPMLRRSHAS